MSAHHKTIISSPPLAGERMKVRGPRRMAGLYNFLNERAYRASPLTLTLSPRFAGGEGIFFAIQAVQK